MLEFSRLIFKLSVKSLQKSLRDWSLVTLGNLPGSVLPDISKSFLKTFLHRSLFRMNHSMKRIDWAGVRIWSNAVSFLLATDAECKRRLCSIVSTMDAAAAILLSFWSRTRTVWILLDIVLRWEGTFLKKSADINIFHKKPSTYFFKERSSFSSWSIPTESSEQSRGQNFAFSDIRQANVLSSLFCFVSSLCFFIISSPTILELILPEDFSVCYSGKIFKCMWANFYQKLKKYTVILKVLTLIRSFLALVKYSSSFKESAKSNWL